MGDYDSDDDNFDARKVGFSGTLSKHNELESESFDDIEFEEDEEIAFDESVVASDEGKSIGGGTIGSSTQASEFTDDHSKFTSGCVEAMELLRHACTMEISKNAAKRALDLVLELCKARFHTKERLGESGAAEYLCFLFERWRDDNTLIILICKTVSEFMVNETDNKILMGMQGLAKQVVHALKAHHHSGSEASNYWLVIKSCCQVIIDMSNSRLNGLLAAHLKDAVNPLNPLKSICPSKVGLGEENWLMDNRQQLAHAGACKLLPLLLEPLCTHNNPHSHPQHMLRGLDIDEVIIVIVKAIATLAEHDQSAKIFGEEKVCKMLPHLLSTKHGHHYSRINAVLWAVIVLCSDPGSGNKQRFGLEGVVAIILDMLHEVMRSPVAYSKDKMMRRYVEYLAWALEDLLLDCDGNIAMLRQITFAEVVVDNLMSSGSVPLGARQKLLKVKETAYGPVDDFRF